MLKIACVLRSGGVYDATWVARLAAGVRQHLPVPHQFVCLTDAVEAVVAAVPGVENVSVIGLRQDWPGWWAKMEMFSLPGPVLAIDLDTLILGDLSDIAQQAEAEGLVMLRDFYRPKGLGSGLMAWSGDSVPAMLLAQFRQGPAHWMKACAVGGDQEFLERATGKDCVTRWQDVVPGQVVSYKADNCTLAAPDGARVMCLHGLPKFPDMPPDSWARRAWEALA